MKVNTNKLASELMQDTYGGEFTVHRANGLFYITWEDGEGAPHVAKGDTFRKAIAAAAEDCGNGWVY